MYGWVSLRTKDGVQILKQKEFQGKVSVKGDKGFEKAFEERFQTIRKQADAAEYENRKRAEQREEEFSLGRGTEKGAG